MSATGIGPNGQVLRCDDPARQKIEWPRYQCFRVDDEMVARLAPDEADASFFVCSEAPPPTVARVLVVSGTPILFTDQTLERLDPTTFASTAVGYHPSQATFGYRELGLVWSGLIGTLQVMSTVNVSEAKATLSQLVERVLGGEEITIGRRGKAEVRLVAVARPTEPRQFGTVVVPDYWMSDDFDAPLDDLAEDFDPA